MEPLDIGRRAMGDGDIEVGLGEVDAAIGCLDGEADIGVRGTVCRQPTAEPLGDACARFRFGDGRELACSALRTRERA